MVIELRDLGLVEEYCFRHLVHVWVRGHIILPSITKECDCYGRGYYWTQPTVTKVITNPEQLRRFLAKFSSTCGQWTRKKEAAIEELGRVTP